MSFKLDLAKRPIYKVVYGKLEISIQPLNKREDVKLVEKFTKGRLRILQGEKKKGFRKKEKDELLLPDTDYIELNLERAKKTWQSWNLEDFECNAESITLMFENHYDDIVVPIIDKLDEMINDEEKIGEGEYQEVKS